MTFHYRVATFMLLILCLTTISAAQDTEKASKWKGDLGLSLTLNTGNSNNSNFSFTAHATGQLSEKIEWVNSGLFQFARSNEVTSTELYHLATGINWHHSDRVFTFYEVLGIRDRFKNYSYRISPAIGAGYKFVNLKNLILWIKAGLSDVLTKYYDSGETDSYIGAVLSNEFVWKFSETAELNQSWYINLSTRDSNHYLSYFEANLIAQLIKSWSLNLTCGGGDQKERFFLSGWNLLEVLKK